MWWVPGCGGGAGRATVAGVAALNRVGSREGTACSPKKI